MCNTSGLFVSPHRKVFVSNSIVGSRTPKRGRTGLLCRITSPTNVDAFFRTLTIGDIVLSSKDFYLYLQLTMDAPGLRIIHTFMDRCSINIARPVRRAAFYLHIIHHTPQTEVDTENLGFLKYTPSLSKSKGF